MTCESPARGEIFVEPRPNRLSSSARSDIFCMLLKSRFLTFCPKASYKIASLSKRHSDQSRIIAYYCFLPASRSSVAKEPAAPKFNRLAIQFKLREQPSGNQLQPFTGEECRLAYQTPNPEFDDLEHHCASLPKRPPEE